MRKVIVYLLLLIIMSTLLYIPVIMAKDLMTKDFLLTLKMYYGNVFLILFFLWILIRKRLFKPFAALGIFLVIVFLSFTPEMVHHMYEKYQKYLHDSKERTAEEIKQEFYPDHLITRPLFEEVKVEKSSKHLTISLIVDRNEDPKDIREEMMNHIASRIFSISSYRFFETISYRVAYRDHIYLFENMPLLDNPKKQYKQIDELIRTHLKVIAEEQKK